MARLLTRLVRLFPDSFQRQFGAAMSEQIEADWHAARARSRRAALWFGARTIVNSIYAAAAERCRPTWFDHAHSRTETRLMRRTFDGWMHDLKLAARALRRAPAFSLISIGTLSLAIGATAAMFAVVKTVLVDPLPYGNQDRLIFVVGQAPGSDIKGEFGLSNESFLQYREQSKLIEDLALTNSFTNTMRAGDRVERIRMSAPTYTLFTTLGSAPILGRLPIAKDESRVAVLSYALWQTWFGGDTSVIGRSYPIGGMSREVIGVMGPDFHYPSDGTLVWIPHDVPKTGFRIGAFGDAGVARMKPGVTVDQVQREFTALARQLPAQFGGSAHYAEIMARYQATVRPLRDEMVGDAERPLWVLFAAAGFVLLIACANVANLFLVRSEGRLREMAVRQAVGAGRGQLVRVQMAEALLIALAAGIAAVFLARAALPLFLRLAPSDIPRLGTTTIDIDALLFTGIAALFTALACGLLSAWHSSSPSFNWLRDGARGSTRKATWGRHALVVAQTALALVLLIGSGLLMRSHAKLSRVHAGYDTDDLFTFQIAPEQPQLTDGPSFARFDMDFMDRIRALPGVRTVGLVENIPLDEGTDSARFRTEGTAPGSETGPRLNYNFAGGDYYKAMGIRLLKGRVFTKDDAISTLGNVVVSKSAAAALWPGQDPLGRKVQRDDLTTWETVVGVVDDVMQDNFRDPPQAVIYFPLTPQIHDQWAEDSPAYVVKTARAETIAPEIRAIIHQIAPESPMYRVYTMSFLADRTMRPLSFTMLTLGLVSTLALILGAVGLYGVLSFVVAERTREIGVRMALGAQAGRVRWMIVGQGMRVVGIGVAIGLIVAIVSTRALGSLLFGVEAFDLATFAGMSISMIAIGILASYLPARRASNVDPIQSLR